MNWNVLQYAAIAAAVPCVTAIDASALVASGPGLAWGSLDTDSGQWALQTGTTGNASVIATDLFAPYQVEFEPGTQTLFWAYRNFSSNGGAVRRIGLDGSGFQSAGADLPTGIAIDADNSVLFVTEQASERITQYSTDLPSAAPSTILFDSNMLPAAIDLDSASSTLFFMNANTSPNGDDLIESITTNGTNRQTLASGLTQVTGLAVDPAGQKVYWADLGINSTNDTAIWRINFDGTQQEAILSNLPDIIIDMEIDPVGGRIYWTARDEGAIKSASLDGQGVQVEVAGLTQPHGLALIPEPASLTTMALLGLATIRRRRA